MTGLPLRTLARACVLLFALSACFPLAAGLLNVAEPPRWLGVADVAVAALLILVAATVTVRVRSAVADRHRLVAFRATQNTIVLIPALLALNFIVGSRINWTVMVIGLAWRGWLFLYSLPFLAAALPAVAPPGNRLSAKVKAEGQEVPFSGELHGSTLTLTVRGERLAFTSTGAADSDVSTTPTTAPTSRPDPQTARPPSTGELNVRINGVRLDAGQLANLQRQYHLQFVSGDFWYDRRCGAWGVVGSRQAVL